MEEVESTPEEIAKIIEQLANTPNDPNLHMLECHCFSLDGNPPNCKECSVYIEHAAKYPDSHIKRS